MRPITREEFDRTAESDPYWRGRWPYLAEAIRMAEFLQPRRVLEVGAAGLPLFPGSDTLDVAARYEPTYLHDARQPWPIPDNAYDLVIALQVFEHLAPAQGFAFREALRVAPALILSVPFLWHENMPHSRHAGGEHLGIDEEVLLAWFGQHPVRGLVVADRLIVWYRREAEE